MLNKKLETAARTLWDYLRMKEPPNKADIILVLGSHDLRVAQRGADLFNQGFAPLIMFSGGFGRLTGDFKKPEAEMFADVAIDTGVPSDKILIRHLAE